MPRRASDREVGSYALHVIAAPSVWAMALGLAVARIFTMIPLPLVGLVIDLAIWVMVMRFAVELLRHASNGGEDAPEGDDFNITSSHGWRQLVLLFIVAILAALAFSSMDNASAALFSLAVLTVYPAVALAIALDESELTAINPSVWIRLWRVVGSDYLVSLGLICCAVLSLTLLPALMLRYMPTAIMVVGSQFVAHMALLATFAALGRTLYLHRDALGWEPADVVPTLPRPRNPEEAALYDAVALNNDGEREAAIAHLEEVLSQRGLSLQAHSQLREWLLALGDATRLQRHSEDYMRVLMVNERWLPALQLAQQQFPEQMPGILPDDLLPDLIEAIPDDSAEVVWVVPLVQHLARQRKTYPGLNDLCLRAARLAQSDPERRHRVRELAELARDRARTEVQREQALAFLAELDGNGGAAPSAQF